MFPSGPEASARGEAVCLCDLLFLQSIEEPNHIPVGRSSQSLGEVLEPGVALAVRRIPPPPAQIPFTALWP